MKLYELKEIDAGRYRYRVADDLGSLVRVLICDGIPYTGCDSLDEILDISENRVKKGGKDWTIDFNLIAEGFDSLEELKYMYPELFI
jgi:hypothetical protein